MRHGSLIALVVLALGGCPGGDGAIGEFCSDNGDCSSQLQCISNVCVPRCERAPDCGDGYSCTEDGLCRAATGQTGDTCGSEVDCSAGLSCQIQGNELGEDGLLLASCVGDKEGRPSGAQCSVNGDCRNNNCDLGHCLDLCSEDRDCGTGTLCTQIPRRIDGLVDGIPTKLQAQYHACLQAHGAVRWSIPMHSANEELDLPVPANARSVSLMFSIDDPNQRVGATELWVPVFDGCAKPPCDVFQEFGYYTNPFARHRTELGESVMTMPISPAPSAQLRTGVYTMRVQSQRPTACLPTQQPPCVIQGTATPTVDAVIKVDDGAILDLHFYFLNLDDHPCGEKFAGKLDATIAQNASYFESFLSEIKNIIGTAVYFEVGNVTYEDLRDHADLDGLDVDNASSLLALGSHSTGVNVFFVRTLSPIGLQAVGPNPGPAGLANTRKSGIVIGVDTLCYRSWNELARLTAHEIARYMGLFDNVSIDANLGIDINQVDPIPDSDLSSTNLMFYSELGGTFLSEGQKQILRRSAVLR